MDCTPRRRGAPRRLRAPWPDIDEFTGTRYLRIKRVQELQQAGEIDDDLRRRWSSRRAMIFTPTRLQDAFIIDVERRKDERGFLARVFCETEFDEHGLATRFVQASTIFTPHSAHSRGLHYQEAPHREVKLVRCTRGAAQS